VTARHPACPPIQADAYARLERRIGRCHLNQRLGIEHDFEARIFGQGRNFFHIENWNRLHTLLRHMLKLSLLYPPASAPPAALKYAATNSGWNICRKPSKATPCCISAICIWTWPLTCPMP
jgi:hypothetical protein